jgi:hypothetical protein
MEYEMSFQILPNLRSGTSFERFFIYIQNSYGDGKKVFLDFPHSRHSLIKLYVIQLFTKKRFLFRWQ